MDIQSTASTIHITKRGAFGYLVINRPDKRNALTQAMWEAIPQAVRALECDSDVRVVIVKSATNAVFAAGADIEELQTLAADKEGQEANRTAIREAQRTLAACKKPTIAQISGACVGGGCGIALHCDFRYAAPDAIFGITPTKLGIIYPLSDTKRLVDTVGAVKAKALLFTGKKVDSSEALMLGLIDHMSVVGELEGDVEAFASTIAAGSQYSVRYAKNFIERVLAGQMDDDAETAQLFCDAQNEIDAEEGIKAFLEKRPPNFSWND